MPTGKKFNFDEFIFKNRMPLALLLVGVILITFGAIYFKSSQSLNSPEIEVLESTTQSEEVTSEIIVEIAGAVEKSGVYRLSTDSRVEDLLIAAGGLSVDADREWVDKSINRAAKLIDGQKIYIPRSDEQLPLSSANNLGGGVAGVSAQGSGGQTLVNINSATQNQLEELNGIGPVYGKNIIEQRPYSNIEELVSKGAIPQHVFEKIKDSVGVY